jgi:hypothetical protein
MGTYTTFFNMQKLSTSDDFGLHSRLTTHRNRIRTSGLDLTRWKISDVFYWVGTNAYRGWGFVIRDTVSKFELFVSTGHRFNAGTVAVYTSLWNIPGVGVAGSSVPGGWDYLFLHFNRDYTASTYDLRFDDSTELTYSTGDLKDLSTFSSPVLPTATGFWPTNPLPAVLQARNGGSTWTGRGWMGDLTIDDSSDLPVMSVEVCAAQSLSPVFCTCFGKVFTPETAGDTSPVGQFGFTTTSNDTFSAGFMNRTANRWAHFWTDTDEIITTGNFTIAGDYTYFNELDGLGRFKRRSIPVQSTSYTKGILNPEYFFECAAIDDAYRVGLRIEGPVCPLIRTNSAFTRPYQSDKPWPYFLQNSSTLFWE